MSFISIYELQVFCRRGKNKHYINKSQRFKPDVKALCFSYYKITAVLFLKH